MLQPRAYRFGPRFRRMNPAARAFLAPQRDHVAQPMPAPDRVIVLDRRRERADRRRAQAAQRKAAA